MQKLGLHEACDYYGEKLSVYQEFSNAEDFPGFVSSYLLNLACGRHVLDAGCSFGKLLQQLAPVALSLTGVDQSEAAIAVASRALQPFRAKSKLYVSRLESFEPEVKGYDLVYASWVLGTIQSLDQREQALRNMVALTAPKGRIVLVENAAGGEFEAIRGRSPNDSRTLDYNNWIYSKGFRLAENLNSYFRFESLVAAQRIIGDIWGREAAGRVQGRVIQHPISIYQMQIS
jgi:SAM-dependent methyltransferase